MPRSIALGLCALPLLLAAVACSDDPEDGSRTPTSSGGGSDAGGAGATSSSGTASSAGGASSSSAGGAGGSTGGSAGAGGLEEGPGYASCLEDTSMCQAAEECELFFIGGVCGEEPCSDPSDCPVPLAGDAAPACFDWGDGPFCGLDCGAGAECPPGMTCFLDMWCTFALTAPGGGVCPDADLGSTVPQTFTGDTTGLTDDTLPILSDLMSKDDALLSFTAPETGLFSFDVTSAAMEPYLFVLEACGGAVVAESSLAATSDTGMAHMTLSLDAGQTVIIGVEGPGTGSYTLDIALLGAQLGAVECCSPSSAPGCAVQAVEDCICGLDTFCCNTAWDGVCAHRAGECGADCF